MLTAERKKLLTSVGMALLAQALLFAPLPAWMRVGLFLLWAVFIPGHLFAEVVGRDFGAPPTRLEWGLYAVGCGYALLLILSLILSYIPGALPSWSLHVGVDLVLLLLVVAAWPIAGEDALPTLPLPRWEMAALLLIVAMAAIPHLVNLGDDALLLLPQDRPAEILLTTAIAASLGDLPESVAHLPFAVAYLTALATLFWLARRLAGKVAGPVIGSVVGLAATLLLAISGFYLGLARIMQEQGIMLMMFAVTLLILVRLWQKPRAVGRGLTLAAILLAVGLWAYF